MLSSSIEYWTYILTEFALLDDFKILKNNKDLTE